MHQFFASLQQSLKLQLNQPNVPTQPMPKAES
jgi:hypothetical protein